MKKLVGLAGMLVLACLFQGCGRNMGYVPENAKYDKSFTAMDTYMTFAAYGKNAENGLEDARRRVQEIENICSVTREGSEIYGVNHRTENTVSLGKESAKLLREAMTISERSGGAFDVTMYPVLQLWGFTDGKYQVPGEEALKEALGKTGYQKINVDTDGVELEAGMEIDFGGIAKGYAGDEAAVALKNAGVKSAILSLGGNIQTVGTKPDGSDWNVAIKDPEHTDQYMGVLKVSNQAVVTSGGYERYFEQDGKKYWHILDPKTGYPAQSGLLSVTVTGSSGMECDALSTAFFVMGLKKAINYYQNYGGIEAVFLTDTKEVWVTQGLEKSFTLTGDYEKDSIHYIEKKS